MHAQFLRTPNLEDDDRQLAGNRALYEAAMSSTEDYHAKVKWSGGCMLGLRRAA